VAERDRAVVIAGGGTGGHVFPGLALADELRRRRPSRPVRWIGARGGLEERLVPRHGLPLTVLPLAGAARMGARRQLRAGLLALAGTLRCIGRFLRRRPALLVGVGGFASGPAALAAVTLGVPTLLLEQNAVPGATNRLLSRFAGATAASFEQTAERLRGRVVVTGNPVRAEVLAIAPREPGGLRRVLAFGGSRGARSLNEAWMDAAPRLADLPLDVLVQTGPDDHPRVEQSLARSAPDWQATPFIDDLPDQLARADLVVCRAGATTVAELTAAGRAALLVPYPFAAGDHQRANARALAERGAAVVIDPDELSGERLAAALRELAARPERVDAMAAQARGLGRRDALAQVTALAESLAGGGR
jgi:UDP-N-acetylglucosamine--N-acetylmuramyl-(pentapeptide) pyrophosphoryl-undecaprenol N-acetylglucosamine transferase